jgi:DNA invertase Pin-like site-specific DNA recombinase
MDAVLYLRCSGESQIEGDSFPRQRASIQKFAKAQGFESVREFRDEGVPGKTELEGRAGLSECIGYVREHGVSVVLVESADRLARDLIVSELLIREFQKIGVRVIAAAGGVDLTEGSNLNPTAKLIRQILAAVAEFEKNSIVLRMRAAKDRIRARDGRCEGQKPYGTLPGEQSILDAMRSMRMKGASFADVAASLQQQGCLTRSGQPWRASTVCKILAR